MKSSETPKPIEASHSQAGWKGNQYSIMWLLLWLILLMGAVLHLTSGAMQINIVEAIKGSSDQQAWVLWELRIPRLLLVMFVGAGLAVAGVVLQALFRNPLAEPGLIGVSSSAALGAVFVIVLGAMLWGDVSAWQMSLAAILSAILVTFLIYRLATKYGYTDVALMLLAGVAINAIAGAATQLLISISDDSQLRTVIFWMMGSFANSEAINLWLLIIVTSITTLLFIGLAKPLNALLLGEQEALYMGFNPKPLKLQIMWGSAVMVGLAVATVGVIGFVGLIVPHIARLMVGNQHQRLIPFSALLGAALLLYADWFAKTVIAPAELPIGLFMALLGGPFFLAMLLQQRNKWRR